MQRIDYWRNWTPEKQMKEETPTTEPTKPPQPSSVSFVSPTPEYSPIISSDLNGRTEPNGEAWIEDFHIWKQERCASRETHEDWGGVGALLVDFAEWSVARNEVPCSRPTLEDLLRDAGFLIANGMVRGLVLKADLKPQ